MAEFIGIGNRVTIRKSDISSMKLLDDPTNNVLNLYVVKTNGTTEVFEKISLFDFMAAKSILEDNADSPVEEDSHSQSQPDTDEDSCCGSHTEGLSDMEEDTGACRPLTKSMILRRPVMKNSLNKSLFLQNLVGKDDMPEFDLNDKVEVPKLPEREDNVE